MTFTIGQRVRTTCDIDFVEDGYSAPAGTYGTITDRNTWPAESAGTYGVILDTDPKHLPTLCWPEDITPA